MATSNSGPRGRPPEFEALECVPLGDDALLLRLGDDISEPLNARTRALAHALEAACVEGLIEASPAYASVLVDFDPRRTSHRELEAVVRSLAPRLPPPREAKAELVRVPVVYGGEYGIDLAFVAQRAGLSEAEVVAAHCGRDYLVYMLGFAPGFPYLGGVDERIAAPRLESPRARIAAGSVGIAGTQTGIYPFDSPGGWRIIGRTPLRLFDSERNPPALLRPGQLLRFCPIAEAEFLAIRKGESRPSEGDRPTGEPGA